MHFANKHVAYQELYNQKPQACKQVILSHYSLNYMLGSIT